MKKKSINLSKELVNDITRSLGTYTGSLSKRVGYVLNFVDIIQILKEEKIIGPNVKNITIATGDIELGFISEDIIKTALQGRKGCYKGLLNVIKALLIAGYGKNWKEIYIKYFIEDYPVNSVGGQIISSVDDLDVDHFIVGNIKGVISDLKRINENVFKSNWNNNLKDCKSISIINASTGQGFRSPCWPETRVSARAGEIINVRIYYHNTGVETAMNTRLMLITHSSLRNSITTKYFYGRISSDNGSISFGPVKARLYSAQTLYLHSINWYTENVNEKLTPLLFGQSGKELFTQNGLRIGAVEPSWNSQGSLVIAFKVG